MSVAKPKEDTSRSRIKQNGILTAACAFFFCTLLKQMRQSMSMIADINLDLHEKEVLLVEDLLSDAEHAVALPDFTTIPIFYNLFIEKEVDILRVSNFVQDQLLEFMQPSIHGPIFINSIGVVDDLRKLHWPPTINATLVHHYKQGDEVNTLQELWSYCNRPDTHPGQKVVYLHSKGSFHGHEANDKLRVYLTKGALSKECSNMPDACNVCSSRMSPLPHPHTSGNMWLSRCDYVRKLIEPKNFADAMQRTNRDNKKRYKWACYGLGRFASEHWVHSHPDVAPCDVDDSSTYTWNYADIPGKDFQHALKKSPRWEPKVYLSKKTCPREMAGISLRERLAEYAILYNQTPPSSWYGWDWYPKGS